MSFSDLRNNYLAAVEAAKDAHTELTAAVADMSAAKANVEAGQEVVNGLKSKLAILEDKLRACTAVLGNVTQVLNEKTADVTAKTAVLDRAEKKRAAHADKMLRDTLMRVRDVLEKAGSDTYESAVTFTEWMFVDIPFVKLPAYPPNATLAVKHGILRAYVCKYF